MQETQLFGKTWCFTDDAAASDTAWTNVALGAHTDTTYFSTPAGVQVTHVHNTLTRANAGTHTHTHTHTHTGGVLWRGLVAVYNLRSEVYLYLPTNSMHAT